MIVFACLLAYLLRSAFCGRSFSVLWFTFLAMLGSVYVAYACNLSCAVSSVLAASHLRLSNGLSSFRYCFVTLY